MKKVLVVSYCYLPSEASSALQTVSLVRMLPKEDWTPIVLTVAPEWQYLPTNTDEAPAEVEVVETMHWKVLDAIERERRKDKPSAQERSKQDASRQESPRKPSTTSDPKNEPATLSFYKVYKHARRTARSVYRYLRPTDADFLFPFFAFQKGHAAARRRRPIAIYSIGKPFSSLVAGQMLAGILRLPHVVEFHDPWTISPSYSGRGPTAWFEKRLERWLVGKAKAVIAKTDGERKLIRDAYPLSAASFFTVPCGFDETRLPDPTAVPPPRSGLDGVIRLVHTGSLSERRSPVNFLHGVKRLLEETPALREKLRVYFAGRFGCFEGHTLPEWLGRLGLSDVVEIKGWLGKDGLYDLMSEADIFVVFPDTWHQIPAKIYEYLWFGRRILVVCEQGSESAKLVNKHDRGVFASRSDPNSISSALRLLVEQCRTSPGAKPGEEDLFQYSARGRARAVAEILTVITSIPAPPQTQSFGSPTLQNDHLRLAESKRKMTM